MNIKTKVEKYLNGLEFWEYMGVYVAFTLAVFLLTLCMIKITDNDPVVAYVGSASLVAEGVERDWAVYTETDEDGIILCVYALQDGRKIFFNADYYTINQSYIFD